MGYFQPEDYDPMMPSQWNAANARGVDPQVLAARRLMAEVLRQAVHDLELRHDAGALDWLLSDSRADLFSFRNICEELGADRASLRARIAAGEFRPALRPWGGRGRRVLARAGRSSRC